MRGPKRTASSVLLQLERGLRNETIILRRAHTSEVSERIKHSPLREPDVAVARDKVSGERAAISGSKSWATIASAASIIISITAALLTVVMYSALRRDRETALQAQIQIQMELAHSQRQLASAQLAASLLPILTAGNEQERDKALGILGAIDPDAANRVAVLFSEQYQFRDAISRARQYHLGGFDPQACREYLRAYNSIPTWFAGRVPQGTIAKAKTAYESGRFNEAAALLAAALDPLLKAPEH